VRPLRDLGHGFGRAFAACIVLMQRRKIPLTVLESLFLQATAASLILLPVQLPVQLPE